MSLAVDYVTDNGDNSLTITGHDGDQVYTTSAGRKSDLPDGQVAQMTYYKQILSDCLPPEQPVLYQAPGYTPPDPVDDTSQTDDQPV